MGCLSTIMLPRRKVQEGAVAVRKKYCGYIGARRVHLRSIQLGLRIDKFKP